MSDVYIGKGKLAGKGVYAARNFAIGEVVKYYDLKPLTQSEFDHLPDGEKMFVHSFWGKMYLFPEPSRYTNHSPHPNTESDLQKMCDIAIRPIRKGEMVTTNATHEVQKELETFIENYEGIKELKNFKRIKGGYRNAIIHYTLLNGSRKKLTLKRVDGNWHVVKSF